MLIITALLFATSIILSNFVYSNRNLRVFSFITGYVPTGTLGGDFDQGELKRCLWM